MVAKVIQTWGVASPQIRWRWPPEKLTMSEWDSAFPVRQAADEVDQVNQEN